jgi:acryloyl-coenzyme A reductase
MVSMRAIRQVGYGGLEVLEEQELPVRSPEAGEVVVRVVAAASCFMDASLRRGMRRRMQVPRTIGHEGSGIIEQVGEGVPPDRIGEAVLLKTGLHCNECRWCLGDRSGLCLSFQMLGEELDGPFAEFITLPAPFTMPIPEGVSFAAAAIASCGISSAESGVTAANIQLGDTVLVRGAASGIGIHAALLARIAGAGRVIGTTTTPAKADFLDSHGIEPMVVRVGEEAEGLSHLKEITDGGADVMLDVVGAWGDHDYSRWVARGGKLSLIGDLLGDPIPINPSVLIYRGVEITVGLGSTHKSIERCLRVLATGSLTPVLTAYEGFEGLMETQRVVEEGAAVGRAVAIVDPDAEERRMAQDALVQVP